MIKIVERGCQPANFQILWGGKLPELEFDIPETVIVASVYKDVKGSVDLWVQEKYIKLFNFIANTQCGGEDWGDYMEKDPEDPEISIQLGLRTMAVAEKIFKDENEMAFWLMKMEHEDE